MPRIPCVASAIPPAPVRAALFRTARSSATTIRNARAAASKSSKAWTEWGIHEGGGVDRGSSACGGVFVGRPAGIAGGVQRRRHGVSFRDGLGSRVHDRRPAAGRESVQGVPRGRRGAPDDHGRLAGGHLWLQRAPALGALLHPGAGGLRSAGGPGGLRGTARRSHQRAGRHRGQAGAALGAGGGGARRLDERPVGAGLRVRIRRAARRSKTRR